MNTSFNYIDLFAGCGGLSLGLHKAGWKGLFAIEKSPQAFETLEYNLIKKNKHFDWVDWLPQEALDINNVLEQYESELKELQGKVTMVAGGPPCQGFSTAGRRVESDTRNSLVKSYIRFIELVSPSIIFFENVKGFTMQFQSNKSKGKIYANEVETALEKLGYKVKGKLVDFSKFGVPQKRTRFILIGIKESNFENTEADDFFELIESNKTDFLTNKNIGSTTSLEDAISDLLKKHGSDKSPDTPSFQAGKYSEALSNYQKLMRNGKRKNSIADSHRFAKHFPATIEKFDFAIKNGIFGKNIGPLITEKYGTKKRNLVVLDKNSVTPTITTTPDDYVHYSEPRILTVREFARIQSFPDSFKFRSKYTTGGKLRTKEVPRYSQVGNAIPPLFAEQSGIILHEMIKNAK
jgi:DNA (cytosine-5)-methyltransferase 1